MAVANLLALLDDIASVLDDVALMTKVAARKTAGVLGDDLALNAQQVSGAAADRELPIVYSVAKGSLINKAILIPAALIISLLAPWLIRPLLMLGGAYLCFEGAEKVWHKLFKPEKHADDKEIPATEEERAAQEKVKIRGAVRTDFVLSAEIIVISMGTIPADASMLTRSAVLILIGLLMTFGVYGLVALIVKLDDFGFFVIKKARKPGLVRSFGEGLVGISPRLMRLLTVVGTIAMFMVGGGILAHGLPWIADFEASLATLPMSGLIGLLVNAATGLTAGLILLAPASAAMNFFKKTK